MPKLNRMFALIGLLATVGAFAMDAMQFAKSDTESGSGATRKTATCDFAPYQSKANQLFREKAPTQAEAPEPELLGKDRHFDYFYDYANDDLFCKPHGETGPLVLGLSPDRNGQKDWGIFWVSMTMIAFGFVGLLVMQVIRALMKTNE
ncbi:MAG: hypothetical protein ACFCUR_13845 [Rhodomicrobiaceae bacterium]